MSEMKSHLHIFNHVSAGRLTSEEGAAWMMGERYRENYERPSRVFDIFMLANTVAWFVFALVKP